MMRKDAVDFLKSKPYKLGHLLGFNKLTELHNKWIVDMLKGKEDKTLQAHRGLAHIRPLAFRLCLH